MTGFNSFPSVLLEVGPERTGSGLQRNAFGCEAWVTLVFGRRRWVVLPPDYCTWRDEASLSAAEWFATMADAAAHTPGALVFTQEAGETVYLPPGVFHVSLSTTLSMVVGRLVCRFARGLLALAMFLSRLASVSPLQTQGVKRWKASCSRWQRHTSIWR